MHRIFIFFSFLFLLCGMIVFVSANLNRSNQTSNTKINVITTFYPIYFFTKEIGADLVNITNIVPTGIEPHEYEPTTQDVVSMQKSKLIFSNGSGLEPWIERMKFELTTMGVKIISLSNGIASRTLENKDGLSTSDPHTWLDPVLAQNQAELITSTLITLDPSNQNAYLSNKDSLLRRLKQLDQEYRTSLANCKQKKAITSHAAFGYLADRYNFIQIPIVGISPEEEPSAQKLAELTRLIKQNKIKHVFFESLISPKLTQTLAQETNITALVFDPLEGISEKSQNSGSDYFSIQKQNIRNLKIALECK